MLQLNMKIVLFVQLVMLVELTTQIKDLIIALGVDKILIGRTIVVENNKTPDECYKEYGADLDGCSRQENQGCMGCSLLIKDK